MANSMFVFAYFAPETLLPLTSIAATIAGVTMMLGRGSLRFIFRCLRRGVRRPGSVAGVSRPHFPMHEQKPLPTSARW
jgi:hypothetical protein